jgi:putative redox protein
MDTEIVDVETINHKSTRVTARHHSFVQDKPAENGGTDKGPMASEYWAASLAACHITTAHKIAEKRQQKIEKIKIRAATHIDGDFIKKVDLQIHVVGDLAQDEVETIFRLTERICTISKATSVPIERKITLASTAKA